MYFFENDVELKILGVSGLAESGKDYLAKSVAWKFNLIPLAMASHFKVEVAVTHDHPIAHVFGTTSDRPDRVRKLLQTLGSEKGRHVLGEDIWCRHTEAWMWHFSQYGCYRFIIPDVRFPNEVEWIQSLGGKVVRVYGRGGITSTLKNHESENALTDTSSVFDATFNNSVDNERTAVERFTALTRSLLDVR